MMAFVVMALAMSLLIGFVLVRPLLGRQPGAGLPPTRAASNRAILQDQLQRLQRDRDADLISADDYTEAFAELQRQVLEEAASGASATSAQALAPASRSWPWALALVGALTLLTGLSYGRLGQLAALQPGATSHAVASRDLETLVAGLEEKLRQDPENLRGWTMLARSYKMLGRNVEAEQAFGRAEAFVQNDAQLLAIYAELAASNADGNFAGKPKRLVEQALKVDPNNPMVLWLAGSVAYQERAFSRALDYWERLQGQVDPNSEDAPMLEQALSAAREQATKAGPAPASKP